AYLAGIPQRPNAYSPFDEDTLRAGIERQHTVLKRMLDNGKISETEYEEAKQFDIANSLAKGKKHVYEEYPYLFEAIQERTAIALMKADGVDADALDVAQYDDMLTEYKQKAARSEEHTSELQSRENLVCRLLPGKKKGPETLAARLPSTCGARPATD